MTEIVTALFDELERRGVRYAVLRNYERLPALERDDNSGITTDIDLVVDSRDLDRWRAIAMEMARKHEWDALVECDHWRQSKVRHHHIDVFRFYRLSPLAFLQVDVFHGYLLWGLPFAGEQELLEGRKPHSNGLLTCVDPIKEAAFRLLQVYGLLETDPEEPKIERYRRKLISFCETRRAELEAFLKEQLSGSGVRALAALERGDLDLFVHYMSRAKSRYVLRFLLRRPLHAGWCVVNRWREHRLRFRTRQCGWVMPVHAPQEWHKRLVSQVMDRLVEVNMIDKWKQRTECAGQPSGEERAIMEQGGLVVEWSDRPSAELDVCVDEDFHSLAAAIVRLLAVRHQITYCSETFWRVSPAEVTRR